MNTKELLLKELKNISPNKCDIKISRNTDYSLLFSATSQSLKCITYISIISDCLTATISSNDGASFSVYNKGNVLDSKSYHIDHEGLFKEVYNAIKHLLVIEV